MFFYHWFDKQGYSGDLCHWCSFIWIPCEAGSLHDPKIERGWVISLCACACLFLFALRSPPQFTSDQIKRLHLSSLWHTFIKGCTQERKISSERLNMSRSGCVPKASWDISSSIKHTIPDKHRHTHTNKYTHCELYSANRTKTVLCAMQHTHSKVEYTHSLRFGIMTEHPAQICQTWTCSFFFLILSAFCRARQGRAGGKQSCRIEQHITQQCQLYLWRPWTEHAQWHSVNKSLGEASVAVALLVSLRVDPESQKGTTTPQTTTFFLCVCFKLINKRRECLIPVYCNLTLHKTQDPHVTSLSFFCNSRLEQA